MENLWPGGMLDLSQVKKKAVVVTGYTRFESGDVLVPKITPTFEASRSILVPDIPGQVGAGTTEIHVVRPGPDIDPRFLLYIFYGREFLKSGAAEMYGVAGQKRVPDDLLRNWIVDLPDLNEQRRIADFLDAETARIDRLVTQRLRQRELLDELTRSLIDDSIDRLNSIPAIRLGYMAFVQTGVTVDSGRRNDDDAVTLPYLRVANVQVGRVDLGDVAEITVPRKTAAASRLRIGDVLMTEGGDLDKLGRGTVWHGEIPECLHQNHVFAVRPDLRAIEPEYLALFTRTSRARQYFESTGNKTTNLASTSSSKIRDFRVPLPDLLTQRELVKRIDGRLRAVVELDVRLLKQIGALAERRQALITAAVTGQIDVTAARGLEGVA
ncbi:hypothetical protein [Frankia sp. AiPa1]|uniref:restriction endonuclease subunit S n=1 Tax=Frankia sp. AiPa1 TaxID=573492 RepID=UPI00202B6F62|nr:hypothetical protein [Frankia sp. AiPa1]MCL9762812.1 hypothetical protein [Frankia sp. AiPa1]